MADISRARCDGVDVIAVARVSELNTVADGKASCPKLGIRGFATRLERVILDPGKATIAKEQVKHM